MMNGGYVLIDCEGLDLLKGSTPQTITGLRERVETALKSDKMIVACNCKWGNGVSISPISCFALILGDDLIVTASTLQIYISKLDVVTIVNMAPAQNVAKKEK